MKNFVAKVFKTIGDFFLDKSNNGDEKRFWGNALIASGIAYAWANKPSTETWVTAGGMIVLGGAFLGVAALADKIPNQQGA